MLLIWWYIQLISIYICVALHQSATSTCPHSTVHLFACRFAAATAVAAEFISNPIDLNWLYLLFRYTTHTHTCVRWCYSSERFLTHINYAKTPTFCAEQFTLSLFKKQSRSPFINIADVFIYLFGYIEKFLSQFFRLSFALDKRHTALHKMKHIRKQCGHPQIKYNTILLHTVIRPESKNKILGASESTEILFSLRMKCSET